MRYELANRLKEVGFPQPYSHSLRGDRYFFVGDDFVFPFSSVKEMTNEQGLVPEWKDVLTYIPTLDELLLACSFMAENVYLRRTGKDTWAAFASGGVDKEANDPTTAVAELWLILKSKS